MFSFLNKPEIVRKITKQKIFKLLITVINLGRGINAEAFVGSEDNFRDSVPSSPIMWVLGLNSGH